ncbi:MAG: YccF domain-containing protein [Chloroflexi bacterium]|nr:YccF domain-containing protein [Chloroflexota bacterium]
MSFLGNIIWLIFGGFLAGLGYIFGGLLLCITIVGIPFGMQSIRVGIATMTPFGKDVVEEEHGDGFLKLLFNIIWVLLFGWEIAVAHLTGALILGISIVGIPFAKQHIKLIPMSLFPFNYSLKPSSK